MNSVNRLSRIRSAARKLAFEELYSHFAWAYDWVSRTFFLGQWRLWQLAALRYLCRERVLEIGMGTGNLQMHLANTGYRTWGVDLSTQMLRQARRKARQSALSFNMCRARAQALPFPDAYFDSVLSTFPSDYIIDPRTLAEIWRVLRPGGRLVIVPGGWLHPRTPGSRIMDWVSKVVYGDNSAGTGLQDPEISASEQVLSKIAASGWVGTLSARMEHIGFAAGSRLLSNAQGSVLVVVGTKPTE